MSKYTITANHLAFGVVEFTLEAGDAKDAFSKFKQIVFAARQWIVQKNGTNDAGAETLDDMTDEEVKTVFARLT
jgi:hypothetical protein